jgi:RNA polymerase subunit RPABC4/transcription elongation factor Spt4
MTLRCRECKGQLSATDGRRCPICGEENPLGYLQTTKWFWLFIGVILLVGGLVLIARLADGLGRIDQLPRH